MRVLVLEDDKLLREQLSKALIKSGFVVDQAQDGEDGLYKLCEFPIDLAIVDLGLPKLSGIDVILNARKKGIKHPILILTAQNQWQEKVKGLEAGADDYLTKPFHFEELLARAHALIRRTGRFASKIIECGNITMDPSSHQVWVKKKPVTLTTFEFKVLQYLMIHSDKVISKQALSEHIYSDDEDKDSNVIEVFIKRLREKLDPSGDDNPIITLRGSGYKIKT